ncbi:dynein regulatory complex subunit 2 [Musca domestica]|uniref:Dynein regulatory complex subunit 2 n=1 Tax=Musca domestica TaxID=7370 RepID=A0ABM3UT38_MUSDO|nr:dynein regulatory complex subunit 2 [Musca domestica]
MATSKPSVTYVDYITDEESPPPETPKKKRLTKAEKRERKMKAEIEFRKMEMYDNLRRELALAKQSSLRGQEEWTDMCRQIKLVQMQEELQSWEAKTNRVLTQKDDKIALILEEIRETEEMHKRNFGMQLKIMDYLSDIFKVFQNVAKLHYEDQAVEVLLDFYNETEEKKQIEDSYQRNCENIMHATNLVTAETLREDFEIYLDKRNDQVNTEIEKRYILRDATAKKMQKLHKQLLQFLDTIRNASLDPHKDERVRTLVERQRTFVVESKKLNDTERKFGRQHEDLRDEIVNEEAEAQQIEERMQRNASDMHDKLKIVTSECYGISKDYQKLQKYGDLLLSLAANCRKLQTESEKVVPWGDFREMESADIPQEDFVLQTIDLQSHVDLNEDELKRQIELMQNFWQRQSIAEAQAIILEKRKQELLQENQIYIEKIKSLSKTDNVEDLRKALHVQCVLEEEPQCPGFKKS